MKAPTCALIIALCVSGLGCAATSARNVGHGSLAAHQSSSSGTQGSTASARDGFAMREVAMREPRGLDRGERGVPTPQPARDPAVIATPIPQPPIPNREPSGSASVRW